MSTLNRSQLSSSFNTNLPDNTSGLITPAVLRGELVNIIDSTLFPQDSGSITASYATFGDGIFSGSFSGSFVGDGTGLTNVTASYVPSYSMPVASWGWVSSYINLTNSIDNMLPWDTEVFNTHPNIFELSGSGTTNARIHIKESGYYEIIGQMHFYDMFNNVDFYVKIMSGSATGDMGLVSLLNDCKFNEDSSDRLINGTAIINVSTPQYYSIAVNPSANAPFPSNANNTPPRMFIKKIG